MYDNATAIQFANDSKFHKNTKHNKKHYHFAWRATKGKDVAIKVYI